MGSRPKTNDTHGGDSGFDYQDLNELHIPSNNGTQPVSTPVHIPHSQASHHQTIQQTTTQTWPFVEIYAHKRYFYLEAQSFCIHGKSEYTYKGPVTSLVKSCNDVKNDGRCLVIR